METTEPMKECLIALSEGKDICYVDYPNFRKIKAIITGMDFNIVLTPIHVIYLEDGLRQEVYELEEKPLFREASEYVKKKVPLKDGWVSADWLCDYEYPEQER